MRPFFVVEFLSLLLFGPHLTMPVAAAGALFRGLTAQPARQPWRIAADAATVIAAVQAAGWAHRTVGVTIGDPTWPWQTLPIAAGVIGYGLVMGIVAHVLTPIIQTRRLNRAGFARLLEGWPLYFVGASIAAALAEVISVRSWMLLPVAAVPVYFAYRAFRDYENRLEHEQRHRAVIDSMPQGVCVV